jgi:hypothetical protein
MPFFFVSQLFFPPVRHGPDLPAQYFAHHAAQVIFCGLLHPFLSANAGPIIVVKTTNTITIALISTFRINTLPGCVDLHDK